MADATPAAPAPTATTSTHANGDLPPPIEPPNAIELTSLKDSKISQVSLYVGRAEITRLYRFSVKTGLNQVTISGLPNVLDKDSLRVEGRGAATIHDVTLSEIPLPPVSTTSPELGALTKKQEQTQRALQRAKKAITSLENYLDSIKTNHVKADDIQAILENYETTGEKLDERTIHLENELKEIDEEMKKEREKLSGPPPNQNLRQRVTIGVFADKEGEVEVALIYAVRQAAWGAGYDIRVSMHSKEKPVTLIYKAAISQSTGEDWTDVPLTLETAHPTFGLEIPTLSPWGLSVNNNYYALRSKSKKSMSFSVGGGALARTASRSFRLESLQSKDEEEEADGLSGMGYRGLSVSSKGNITATFQVPGTISVPSDGATHNVTVVELQLDATMSWVTVPKKEAKTHLKAKIKNASDYTLLAGVASVYVDGSFISKTDVPLVSPQESFDCPLGVDPTIRITYHPRIKKISQSGFYMSKNSNHVFTQRITVFNTKSTTVENLKVVDQFPISEDSQITVKYVSPPLSVPTVPESNRDGTIKAPAPIKAGDGTTAQWDGADEPGFDLETLGKDGKFYWQCVVPSQGKVNLTLSWEVSAPLRTEIAGLTV